ncbi:MAG: cobalamin biosynthesis protein P47K, partial [Deltaproteobacteria bacterium]|nr:cobalamin biosynthesis protein P47K [Deltaproteobacteria bacterium]
MEKTRDIQVDNPVKLIFVGGFLGSGKTTALAGIAKRLLSMGKRVGIVTNDQSDNLADTVIVREMLSELGVPIEEVVAGCFCCKFEELIDNIEKILVHKPDILLGEPVGSCTDFVAAVANPIKIHYHEAFRFAPFSTMVDPDRVRELLLAETASNFPEEVAYLFGKQLEEADILVLNKVDLLPEAETERLASLLTEKYPGKEVLAISARQGDNVERWLEILLSGRPGANTVLSQIDYDRYARAEAVLGWLNAAIRISADRPFPAEDFARELFVALRERFRQEKGEIGHLKSVFTSGGKSAWINLTNLAAEPVVSGEPLESLAKGSLILNARVQLSPETLEKIARDTLADVAGKHGVKAEIDD